MCPKVPIASSAEALAAEPADSSAATARAGEPVRNERTESGSNPLASHLQASIEMERSQLTRQLHDDLGGLLVGALMDVAWVEARLKEPDLQAKLARARDSLRAAVDFKRNLIEGMRPTLLENVGIFAALRWHFAKYCEPAGLTCIAHFPPLEPTLKPNVAIGIYRITEEALKLISGPLQARCITLDAQVDEKKLSVELSHDGVAVDESELKALPEFKSMAQRIDTLNGKFTVSRTPKNMLHWEFVLPIEA